MDLESSISALCGSLAEVLHHAESSSRDLAHAVSQRPIHLDSSTTTFLGKLDLMTEAAGADLQHLESMTFGAVSFAELLGHCGEALKPQVDAKEDAPGISCFGGSSSVLRSTRGRFDNEDALFEESVSLKNLGLSEACLATLSSQATDFSGSPMKLYKKPESTDEGQKIMSEAEIIPPPAETNGQGHSLEGSIRASKEEYEQLPPYMKALASWEELQEAISKLNSYFSGEETQGSVALNQDDIGTISLGRKGRSYLLILLRLNQLAMETVDGSIFYTQRKDDF